MIDLPKSCPRCLDEFEIFENSLRVNCLSRDISNDQCCFYATKDFAGPNCPNGFLQFGLGNRYFMAYLFDKDGYGATIYHNGSIFYVLKKDHHYSEFLKYEDYIRAKIEKLNNFT